MCRLRQTILADIVNAAKRKLQSLYTRKTCTYGNELCRNALIGAFHRTFRTLGIVGEPGSSSGDAHNSSIDAICDEVMALADNHFATLRGHTICHEPAKQLSDEIHAITKKYLTKENMMPKELLEQLAERAQR